MKFLFKIIKLLRVKHWIKNSFIVAPLVFSESFLNQVAITKTFFAFCAFSLIASIVYVINDLADIEKDKVHPKKCKRPLASGDISKTQAFIIICVLVLIDIIFFTLLNFVTSLIIICYFIMNLFYTFSLKKKVIIDVMIVAIGFVLRIYVGATAISVEISNWLILCTLFISLFLGFGKRRHEFIIMDTDRNSHKAVLDFYSRQLLNYLIIISITLTIISYSLYTIDIVTINKLGTDKLILTIPFVVYGLFRYMYNIYRKEGGGDPADVVYKDKTIFLTVFFYIVVVVLIFALKKYNLF